MTDWKFALFAGGAIGIGGTSAGAWLFGSPPAQAQDQAQVFQVQYRECFLARQASVDVNDQSVVEAPTPNRRVRVPNGWTVVSGGGSGGDGGTVMFCRP